MDSLTKEQRSEVMSRVRSKDTVPERRVRRLVSSLGVRYRLHGASLPGRPEVVFAGQRKVIFVHGCFWHRHPRCKLARMPKSRVAFWREKLDGNRHRDLVNQRRLKRLGWRVMLVWECELSDEGKLLDRLRTFLQEDEREVH